MYYNNYNLRKAMYGMEMDQPSQDSETSQQQILQFMMQMKQQGFTDVQIVEELIGMGIPDDQAPGIVTAFNNQLQRQMQMKKPAGMQQQGMQQPGMQQGMMAWGGRVPRADLGMQVPMFGTGSLETLPNVENYPSYDAFKQSYDNYLNSVLTNTTTMSMEQLMDQVIAEPDTTAGAGNEETNKVIKQGNAVIVNPFSDTLDIPMPTQGTKDSIGIPTDNQINQGEQIILNDQNKTDYPWYVTGPGYLLGAYLGNKAIGYGYNKSKVPIQRRWGNVGEIDRSKLSEAELKNFKASQTAYMNEVLARGYTRGKYDINRLLENGATLEEAKEMLKDIPTKERWQEMNKTRRRPASSSSTNESESDFEIVPINEGTPTSSTSTETPTSSTSAEQENLRLPKDKETLEKQLSFLESDAGKNYYFTTNWDTNALKFEIDNDQYEIPLTEEEMKERKEIWDKWDNTPENERRANLNKNNQKIVERAIKDRKDRLSLFTSDAGTSTQTGGAETAGAETTGTETTGSTETTPKEKSKGPVAQNQKTVAELIAEAKQKGATGQFEVFNNQQEAQRIEEERVRAENEKQATENKTKEQIEQEKKDQKRRENAANYQKRQQAGKNKGKKGRRKEEGGEAGPFIPQYGDISYGANLPKYGLGSDYSVNYAYGGDVYETAGQVDNCLCPEYDCKCPPGYNVRKGREKAAADLVSQGYTEHMTPFYNDLFGYVNKGVRSDGTVSPFRALAGSVGATLAHPEVWFRKRHNIPEDVAYSNQNPYGQTPYTYNIFGREHTWYPDQYVKPIPKKERRSDDPFPSNRKLNRMQRKMDRQIQRGIKRQGDCWGGNCYENSEMTMSEDGGAYTGTWNGNQGFEDGGFYNPFQPVNPLSRFVYAEGGMTPEEAMMMQQQGAAATEQGMPPQQGEQASQISEEQMQQVVQMVIQMMQQQMPPEQIMQNLVQQGVPEELAQQAVEMVMQQIQASQQGAGPAQPQQQAPPQQMPMGMYGGGMYAQGGMVGQEMEVTEEELKELRRKGIKFEIN